MNDEWVTVLPTGWRDLRCRLWYSEVEGRMELVAIHLEVMDGGRALTATDLRSVRLGELADEHRPLLVFDVSEGEQRIAPRFYPKSRKRRGGRPPIYGPDHWIEVARVYREAYAGKRLTPTRAVATHFDVSVTAAVKWVAKCRELGLLPKTTQGKARAKAPTKTKGRKR